MLLERLAVDRDLTEAAIENCVERLGFDKPRDLCVSSCDLEDADLLARQYNLTLYLDTDLPRGAWYVRGKWRGIFSLAP